MTSDPHPQPFRGVLSEALVQRTGGAPADLGAALATLLAADHTNLPVPPAADRSVWSIDPVRARGSAPTASLVDIVRRAEQDVPSPWGVPLASTAARVFRDGNREEWERVVFERQRRLSRAAIAAAVTLEERWIDQVADGVVLLCEQSSWCWPAHDDTLRVHGAVLATTTDPFLDLGAGEVVAQLAWIDQLLGDQLDNRYPGLRERIRHEAHVRVFEPFMRRRDWHWIGLDGDVHNWNPWIHGNVLVAALRLLDDHDQTDRGQVITLALEGLDRYISALPTDGAIDEGYAYWWNGACRALEALDILAVATGDVLDVTASIPALRETVAFPHRMHLGGDWYLNLADGQARPPHDQPWHSLHRAALRVGDTAAAAHAASHRQADAPVATESEGLGRALRGLTDTTWIAAPSAGSDSGTHTAPLPSDVWLPSTQVLIARERAGSSAGLTMAVKGGNNAEHHNHNDVGSVIVASNGVPVLVDAGRPTYTLATFGPDRYSIWTMQSSWHNVPQVRGIPQSAGAQFAASDVAVETGEFSAMASMDLHDAYPASALHSWRRQVRLDRSNNGQSSDRQAQHDQEPARVTVTDRWELEPWAGTAGIATAPEPPTTVRFLLAGDISLGEGVATVTPLDGAPPVRLRWPAAVRGTLVERPLDDPMLAEVWGERLTRLDLDVTGRNTVSVTIEIIEPKVRNPR